MPPRDSARLLLLVSAGVVAILLWSVGLGIRVDGALGSLATSLAGLVGASLRKPGKSVAFDRIVTATEALSMLALFAAAGGIASYAIASISTGYVDAMLVRADRALGLDWIAYWRFIHGSALLSHAFNAAYVSILLSPAVIILCLVFAGEADRAYRLLAAFAIALAVTNLIFFLAPARAAAATYLGLDSPLLGAIHKEHVFVIEGLRSGAIPRVPLDHIAALITFPSFHAACAILFLWASWCRLWLRVPSLAINGTMLLSTPIQGSHYFVDLVGGALVAGLGIALATTMSRHRPKGRTPVLIGRLAT